MMMKRSEETPWTFPFPSDRSRPLPPLLPLPRTRPAILIQPAAAFPTSPTAPSQHTTMQWPATDSQRATLRAYAADNAARMCFCRSSPLPSFGHAEGLARAVEQQAFAFAEASKSTTTGTREASETLRLYLKKAGELLVQAVKDAAESLSAMEAAPAEEGSFDVSAGAREFIMGSAARERFADAISKAGVRRLKLGNKSYDVEAAGVIAEVCRVNCETLEELDMADVLAGRPEEEAMEVLGTIARGVAELCSIRRLDVSDNALGEKGIRALAPLLQSQKCLECVKFQNNGVSAAAAAAIHELLVAPEQLREVHLHNNMAGDEGATSVAALVARAPRLSKLRMTATRVGEDGGRALLEALASLPDASLEHLELTDNMISEENGLAIARVVLKHGACLRHLLVGDTGLGAPGIAAICLALRRTGAPALERVNFAQNEVSVRGATRIVVALGAAPSLTALGLADNMELGERGALVLAKAMNDGAFPALEQIDVSRCQLRGGEGQVALEAVCSSRGIRVVNEKDDDEEEEDFDDEEEEEEEDFDESELEAQL